MGGVGTGDMWGTRNTPNTRGHVDTTRGFFRMSAGDCPMSGVRSDRADMTGHRQQMRSPALWQVAQGVCSVCAPPGCDGWSVWRRKNFEDFGSRSRPGTPDACATGAPFGLKYIDCVFIIDALVLLTYKITLLLRHTVSPS